MLQNLEQLFDKADAIDRKAGVSAYPTYLTVMRKFARYYSTPLVATTEAFVALSPNNDYHGNLRSLASVLEYHKSGRTDGEFVVSTYRACAFRALTYLSGEVDFLEKVKGRKITSFRENILSPHLSRKVTVDGHMIAAAMGENWTMSQANLKLTNRLYTEVEIAVQELADQTGLTPCQMQATLWFTRKRTLRVKYDPQLNLFAADPWQVDCDPQDFLPYPWLPGVHAINCTE